MPMSKFFFLLQLAICLGSMTVESASCPDGWELNGDQCYLINFNPPTTWFECQSYCSTNNAHMLCVENEEAGTFLYNRMGISLPAVWISFNDIASEGNFVWAPECANTGYINWETSTEPSAGLDEHCAFIRGASLGSNGWYDSYCDAHHWLIPSHCWCQVGATIYPTTAPTPAPPVSPTYRVRNGFAFAATTVNGSVYTWGEAPHGGDSSAVQHSLSEGVAKVVSSRFAFAALTTDGTIAAWGVAADIKGFLPDDGPHTDVQDIVANEAAFAGIRAGRLIAFGSRHTGGVVNDDHRCATPPCPANVIAIAASAGAFAALSSDGSVYAWGSKHSGADIPAALLVGVTKVVANREAFAALLSSGRVLPWGGAYAGGDSSSVGTQLMSGVTDIVASKTCFVAFKNDTGIAAWGYGPRGGDTSSVSSQLTSGIIFVAHTSMAMAALKTDGSVVAWGKADGGGDPSAVQAQLVNITKIDGNSKAFATLSSAGKVVAWGKAAYGGQIPFNKVSALSSGVVSIYHTDRAFAALKDDGSVVVWGQAGHGGSPGAAVESLLTSGVHTICSNDVAFSAIKTDGSVVGWGHPVSIPTAGVLFTSSSLTERAECTGM